jgi:hypothetical protein
VGLDPVPERGQRADLRVVDAEPVCSRRALDVAGAAAGDGTHLDPLVARAPLEDLAARGVDHEVVGVDRARDHGLAQAGAGVDDRLAAAAGHGVRREQDARHLGLDHLLDHHGQAHGAVVDAVGGAVHDGAFGPQRRPAPAHGVQHRLLAHDVEVGVLLAGEAGVGQVLGSGRGAHGHRGPLADSGIGVGDGARDGFGDGGGADRVAGRRGRARQRLAPRPRQDVEIDRRLSCDLPIGLGGHAGPRRNGEACADQLAEVRGLAAHHGQGRRVHVGQVEGETVHAGRLSRAAP